MDAPDAQKLAAIERAINVHGTLQIARPKRPVALLTLIGVGVFLGLVSLHVLGFALFVAAMALMCWSAYFSFRDAYRLVFLPEGIASSTLRTAYAKSGITLLPYADVTGVTREQNAVVVQAGERSLRFLTSSEDDPDYPLLDDLQAYLEAKVTEARALAEERATVDAFFRQSAEGGPDYRHPAPPTSALEAIARARCMPMKLRVEAARAIGTEESDLELSEELKPGYPKSFSMRS